MRVFDPEIESVPDFDSATYIYLGVDGEQAPDDTNVGIVEQSVRTIKIIAFADCMEMKRCIIHGHVVRIDQFAFWNCRSLEALFLPSSIRDIEGWAFERCRNIRILPLPLDIDFNQISKIPQYCMLHRSDAFFRTTQIDFVLRRTRTRDQVYEDILDFYRNLNPLYKACLDTNVSTRAIHECVHTYGREIAFNTDYDGMTPLHILALNPHANTGCILACFEANMSAALVRDGIGKTPLDTLLEYGGLG